MTRLYRWRLAHVKAIALRDGAVAEFERALIRERQMEGIELAKKRGAYKGRKQAISKEQLNSIKQRLANGDKKSVIARDFNISREILYQYLNSPAG